MIFSQGNHLYHSLHGGWLDGGRVWILDYRLHIDFPLFFFFILVHSLSAVARVLEAWTRKGRGRAWQLAVSWEGMHATPSESTISGSCHCPDYWERRSECQSRFLHHAGEGYYVLLPKIKPIIIFYVFFLLIFYYSAWLTKQRIQPGIVFWYLWIYIHQKSRVFLRVRTCYFFFRRLYNVRVCRLFYSIPARVFQELNKHYYSSIRETVCLRELRRNFCGLIEFKLTPS